MYIDVDFELLKFNHTCNLHVPTARYCGENRVKWFSTQKEFNNMFIILSEESYVFHGNNYIYI